MNPKSYGAPWGKTLVWMTVLTVLLLLAAYIPIFIYLPLVLYWSALVPLLIIAGALPFVIRGYSISANELIIQRLLWKTHLPLAGLQSATPEPNIMRGSIRLFGNGGLFSITGWYRNRALGTYRAFVTDLNHTVVLRFPNRTLVVSPENPELFVGEISSSHS